MKITRKEFLLFESIGKNLFIDTPANLEFDDGTIVNDKDFRTLVTLRTALSVFKTMGLVQSDETLDLTEPYKP